MNTGDNGRWKLLETFRDKEYRHLFRRASYRRTLAEQVRQMRLSRGWTQAELAGESGKVQETISQLENPNYGNYTLKTLDRLAEAFDVALIVKFVPFSELARWMEELSPEDLAVPDFDHDPGLRHDSILSGSEVNMNSTSGWSDQSAPHNGEDRMLTESSGVTIRPTNVTMRDNVISIEPFLKRPVTDERSVVVK